jgi:hypothetical protein
MFMDNTGPMENLQLGFENSTNTLQHQPSATAIQTQTHLPRTSMNGNMDGLFPIPPSLPSTGHNLWVRVQMTKSRVETQVPLRICLWPMPRGIKKLHLPPHTISKPKLLAKPPYIPSDDTLELHTMLVCTSAMNSDARRIRALQRASHAPQTPPTTAKRPVAGQSPIEGDEDAPLNGGMVWICDGCINRERKRADRKKSKKPEDDGAWKSFEEHRIIVFNTTEFRDFLPLEANANTNGLPPRHPGFFQAPTDAMEVSIPMRIACYCRHHNEKQGFQYVFDVEFGQTTYNCLGLLLLSRIRKII